VKKIYPNIKAEKGKIPRIKNVFYTLVDISLTTLVFPSITAPSLWNTIDATTTM
jgi:hypothetical protein